jgi:hypothetical protein
VENYIVRIYRREADDPDSVVGTVECVESRLHKAFHGLHRLGDLLTHAGMLGTDGADTLPGPPLPAASALGTGADSRTTRNRSEEP